MKKRGGGRAYPSEVSLLFNTKNPSRLSDSRHRAILCIATQMRLEHEDASSVGLILEDESVHLALGGEKSKMPMMIGDTSDWRRQKDKSYHPVFIP